MLLPAVYPDQMDMVHIAIFHTSYAVTRSYLLFRLRQRGRNALWFPIFAVGKNWKPKKDKGTLCRRREGNLTISPRNSCISAVANRQV